MHYVAKLTAEKDGGYSVEFPDLNGCFTQGDTLEEALAMAKDAMELTLQDVFDGDPLPVAKTKPDESKGLYSVQVSEGLAVALEVAAARHGLPQAVVARKMGVSRQAYQRLEDPASNVSLATLRKFANAVGKRLEVKFV